MNFVHHLFITCRTFGSSFAAGWLAGNPCVRACDTEFVTRKLMVSEKKKSFCILRMIANMNTGIRQDALCQNGWTWAFSDVRCNGRSWNMHGNGGLVTLRNDWILEAWMTEMKWSWRHNRMRLQIGMLCRYCKWEEHSDKAHLSILNRSSLEKSSEDRRY